MAVDVYPGGFRVKTIWLRGFSRNPQRITIENPITRTWVDMPMSELGSIVRAIGGHPLATGAPRKVEVTAGQVRGLSARRFRLLYGRDEYIDVWTTTALGPTPQFRAFAEEIVRSISPPAAGVLRSIPGTPVYVELNMGEYRKTVVLRSRRVVYNSRGESEALRVSPFMFPAPFGTIFK